MATATSRKDGLRDLMVAKCSQNAVLACAREGECKTGATRWRDFGRSGCETGAGNLDANTSKRYGPRDVKRANGPLAR